MPKLKYPTKSHPGRAGRKPALFPYFLKKFRATEAEWRGFLSLLTGDARKDFIMISNALRAWLERK